jgi:uncharacterized protein HemX
LVEKETLRCVSNNEGRAYAIAGVVLFVIAGTGLAVWLFRVIRHAKRAEEAATAQQRRQQMEIEMAARTAILQAM